MHKKEKTEEIEKLVRDNKFYEQYIFILAHNFNSSASRIYSLLQLLNVEISENNSELKNSEIIKNLLKSSDYLLHQIQELNAFLKKKHLKKVVKEKISLNILTQEVLASLENLIEKKNISITVNFQDIPVIYSFKPFLSSIFYNLLSNSVKFSDDKKIHRTINISGKNENNILVLTFLDNGMGMELSNQKIFQLYSGRNESQKINGIGLYLVKEHTEELGGKILFDSSLGEWTRFEIHLPDCFKPEL